MTDDPIGAGCFIVVGLVIIGIALGFIFGPIGWLVMGVAFLVLGLWAVKS